MRKQDLFWSVCGSEFPCGALPDVDASAFVSAPVTQKQTYACARPSRCTRPRKHTHTNTHTCTSLFLPLSQHIACDLSVDFKKEKKKKSPSIYYFFSAPASRQDVTASSCGHAKTMSARVAINLRTTFIKTCLSSAGCRMDFYCKHEPQLLQHFLSPRWTNHSPL